MTTERDELIRLIWDDAVADRVKEGKSPAQVPVVRPKVEAIADKILAAGYRKPLTIDNEKLVIDDGLLLLDVGGCTCSPYGSSHELGCGYEYLDDLTKPLARAGYRKPQQVTTVEELEALPPGSAILTARGYVYLGCKTERHGAYKTLWQDDAAGRMSSKWFAESDSLPVTVLHVGGAE